MQFLVLLTEGDDILLTAYKKEDCDSDPGWCFKTAVGRSLPSSFSPKIKRSTSSRLSGLAIGDAVGTLVVHSKANCFLNKRRHQPSERTTEPQKSIGRSHRSKVIHQRTSQADQSDQANDADPAQQPFSKGHSDGLSTARTFASYGSSRLGFVGQFMQDAIDTLGSSVVAPGTEENYKQGFIQGLAEGEAAFGIR